MTKDELIKYREDPKIRGLQIQNPFNQPEAMSLMLYRCISCNKEEVIWNSRPRRTPFTISCSAENCEGHMQHVEWQLDTFAPNFSPNIGDRIFVDYSEEAQIKRAEEVWEKEKGKENSYLLSLRDYLRSEFENKEEYISRKRKNFKFGYPQIITIKKLLPVIHYEDIEDLGKDPYP